MQDQQLNHSVKLNPKYNYTYEVSGGIHVAWAWCREHYGVPEFVRSNVQPRWIMLTNTDGERFFLFSDEADASMFALRWA